MELNQTNESDSRALSAHRTRAALVLAPCLIAFSMGQTVLFAVAGPVIRDIGLTEFQLGMIVSAAALSFVVVSPIWGKLSDSWGRKRVIILGLLAYGMTSVAFAAVMDLGLRGLLAVGPVFFSLLGIRILYALLGAGIQPASVALMADLSDAQNRSSAVAIVGAAFGFGMILGPAAAAALVGWGVLVPLYAIAALGLACMLLAALFLEAPPKRAEEQSTTAKIDLGRLAPILVTTVLFFSGISALQQTIAFYVQDFLSADSETATRMTSFCFVAMAVSSLIVQGGLIQALKPEPGTLLKLGLPIMVIGVLLYGVPVAFWQLILASIIMGVGFGMVNPGIIAAASLRVDANAQGSAAGVTQATMAAGYIIGPLAGTAVYEIDAQYSAVFVGTCMLLANLIAVFLRTPAPSRETASV